MKKKVLLVYPHNPFRDRDGINSRYMQLLKYFRHRDIQTDILTLTGFKSVAPWEPADYRDYIRHVFFFDFKKAEPFQRFKNRKQNPLVWLRKKIPFLKAYTHLPDFAYPAMKRLFEKVIAHQRYDFILISYVYWANLVSSALMKGNAPRTVLDLSDFLTLNMSHRSGGNIKTGALLEEEIRRVNLFDTVMCISEDEQLFFSRFATKPEYHYIPYFMEQVSPPPDSPASPEKFDIMFIGSDNPHNLKGLKWFLESVFPLLPQNTRMQIAGSVSNHAHHAFPVPSGVRIAGMVDNCDEIYRTSVIAVCPLLGGTGLKVKVIEALSRGIPVICTSYGITGFPGKTQNGCVTADSPRHFASAIQRALSDHDYYRELARSAETFFLKHFETRVVTKNLDRIFLGPGDET